MNKLLFLCLCLLLLLPALLLAQPLTYERALGDGQARYEVLDYEDAIKKFEAAKLLAKGTAQQTEISDWLDRAKDARLNALKYQLEVSDSLRQVALIEKQKADSALAVANRVLDQLYFYEGKFGLTLKEVKYGDYKYGYIDRNGEEVIPFSFEEATPFSTRDGFARVSKEGEKYLLDTAGVSYLLAEKLEELKVGTEALDLHGTTPGRLPDNLGDFQNLQVILAYWVAPHIEGQLDQPYISPNQRQLIKELPTSIGQLRRLHTLDLRGNQISNLPPEFVALESLRFLNLQGSQLSALPEGFGQLQHLSYLNLDGSRFRPFSSEILHLTQLRSLHLGGVSSGKTLFPKDTLVIPPEIGSLSHLQVLSLFNAGISQLPAEIGNLNQLHELSLGLNQLEQLPPEIGKLKHLTILDLSYNDLTSLPKSISELTSLSDLDLSFNDIQALPAELHFSPALSNLNLRGNKQLDYLSLFRALIHWSGKLRLTSSPYEYFQLAPQPGLLVSADAPMDELPDLLWEMKEVTILEINGYAITHISPLISQLTQLRKLDLKYNQLTDLPAKIEQLTQLESLDMHGNPIPPSALQQLQSLLPNCQVSD